MDCQSEDPKKSPPSIGAHVLDQVDDVLTKRMVMAETDGAAVVLWIAHTYVYERFAQYAAPADDERRACNGRVRTNEAGCPLLEWRPE